MRTPELEARHRASAIVARMFLVTLRAIMGDFERNNLASVIPDLLIAMVIRLNDDQGKPPASISEITRMTGIPRPTARRHIEQLLERGVIVRKDDGLVGSDEYLLSRVDAPYFKDIIAAIRDAAQQLEAYS